MARKKPLTIAERVAQAQAMARPRARNWFTRLSPELQTELSELKRTFVPSWDYGVTQVYNDLQDDPRLKGKLPGVCIFRRWMNDQSASG